MPYHFHESKDLIESLKLKAVGFYYLYLFATLPPGRIIPPKGEVLECQAESALYAFGGLIGKNTDAWGGENAQYEKCIGARK
ncbi:MAG TPA: hypothetical protein VI959_03095 [Alphaproteobacteria bacterium]|nr:hypothetical protein [Alphaproteobacteria bacterium]